MGIVPADHAPIATASVPPTEIVPADHARRASVPPTEIVPADHAPIATANVPPTEIVPADHAPIATANVPPTEIVPADHVRRASVLPTEIVPADHAQIATASVPPTEIVPADHAPIATASVPPTEIARETTTSDRVRRATIAIDLQIPIDPVALVLIAIALPAPNALAAMTIVHVARVGPLIQRPRVDLVLRRLVDPFVSSLLKNFNAARTPYAHAPRDGAALLARAPSTFAVKAKRWRETRTKPNARFHWRRGCLTNDRSPHAVRRLVEPLGFVTPCPATCRQKCAKPSKAPRTSARRWSTF
jgi:hypothetical protein